MIIKADPNFHYEVPALNYMIFKSDCQYLLCTSGPNHLTTNCVAGDAD
jgi:hypothetical protein